MMLADPSEYRHNVARIGKIAEGMDRDLLKAPGWTLYSSYKTLVRGEYYFLGVNPAGSEEDHPKTVQDSFDNLTNLTQEADRNQFLDVSWYDDESDTKRRPLQERFRYLFGDALALKEPRTVCASNLIFKSSKKETGSGGWDEAEKCWPIHKAIIQEFVQPRVIITHGSLPFDFINNELKGTHIQEPKPCMHAKWTWRCSRLEKGQKLIGLPHLSIYAINSPRVESVVKEIVAQIQAVD